LLNPRLFAKMPRLAAKFPRLAAGIVLLIMYWSTEQERALDKEKAPTKVHVVDVKVDPSVEPATWNSTGLGAGIRSLHANSEGCDVELVVGEEVFPAHQVMLASMSKAFRGFLRELRVVGENVEINSDPMAGTLTIDLPPPPAPSPAPIMDTTNAVTSSSTPDAPPDSNMTEPALAVSAEAPPEEVPPPTAQGSTETALVPAPHEQLVVAEANASMVEASAEPPAQQLKLRVNGIASSEAVKILLSYVYQVGTGTAWEFNPTNVDVDKDVLHLARHFQLDHLHENAARWLIGGLSTHNVVERLVICEEFQLGSLREKMLEQLAAFPDALSIVSNNSSILKHPKIMQDLLMTVAMSNKQQKAPPPPVKKEEKEKEKEKEKEEEMEKVVEKVEKPVKAERLEKEPEKKEKTSVDKPPAKRAKKAGSL